METTPDATALPTVRLDELDDPEVRKRVRKSPAPVIVVPPDVNGTYRRMAERWATKLGAIVRVESD